MNINQLAAGRWGKQIECRSPSLTPINQEWTWNEPQIDSLLERSQTYVSRRCMEWFLN